MHPLIATHVATTLTDDRTRDRALRSSCCDHPAPSRPPVEREKLRLSRASCDLRPHAHPDAADLLRTEHAAVRVLASAESEAEAYPALLAAIGDRARAAPARCGCPATTASCTARRRGRWTRPRPATSPPACGRRGRPDAHSGPPAAFAFPLPGVGVMGFSTAAPLEPDANLLATMDSLGSQISQFVERCRAQADLRESDARKSAILNAAFDCIITMDHDGNVVEVNRATERTFGYRAEEMIGRELAELIVPPGWREAHRAGLERYVRTGRGALGGHPVEAQGMRADGSEFPVELIVTRADLPGPAAVLRLPARRDRGARARARPAPARDRAGGAAAGGDRGRDRAPTRGTRSPSSPRRSGGCSARRARTWSASTTICTRRWSAPGTRATCATCPVGDTVRMDGDTASTRVFRTRRAGPGRQLRRDPGRAGRAAAQARASRARSRRRSSSAAGCGAR